MKKLLTLLLLVVFTVGAFAADPEWLVDKNSKGGKRGGTLFLSAISGPKTFNAAWAQETSSTDIIQWFLDSMMVQDQNGNINQPLMAKTFSKKETASGGSEYSFTLRKGLTWSDGKPIDIDDVIFTFEKIYFKSDMTANGNDGFKDDKEQLPTITKLDEYSVKFTYKGKFRRGYENIGTTQIFPKHIFEKHIGSPDELAKFWTIEQIDKLVGSGPFLVKEYKNGVRILLERNPNYYVKSADGVELPYLDKVQYVIVADQNTERLKFEAGETDLIGPTAENFPALKAMAASKNWKAITGPATMGSDFVTFNYVAADKNKRELFRDVNFRKAVACSLNREAIIDNILNGLGVSLYGPVPPSSSYYNKAVDKFGETELKYSLAKAKDYLSKVKGGAFKNGKFYFNGKPVEFDLTTNTGNKRREEIGALLVDSMAKLGIKVNFRPMQFNAMLEAWDGGKLDARVSGLTGSNDPGSGWNVWRLQGGLHFWNYSPEVQSWSKTRDYKVFDFEKRIDEIFVEQIGTLDDKKLGDLLDEFQMLAAKNQIMVYTVAQRFLIVHKNSLHLVTPMPTPATGSGINPALWNIWGIWKE